MSSIDQVIERSRQPGSLSERKRFTVARSRAIQKMREFALADRSYYILEWIQAAVANGATYLDIAIEWSEVRLSYVGGGFTRSELEALFDFLFASKDDLEVADIRQLALGVNALLGENPDRILIESGDGTLKGTNRIEIDGRRDEVLVGTPMQALDGTFIRVSGLSRSALGGKLKELPAIESRCLTATIPILVNDRPLFGYSSVRSPDLFGYRSVLKFDEGDLYGSIGLATTAITRNFKILTWGTWINSARHEFGDLPPMGGVVGYDRLRKTADHSSVVQDEVYREMWARLEPYARQLASGKSGAAAFDLRLLEGPVQGRDAVAGGPVTAVQFRQLAQERGRAVLFDEVELGSGPAVELARRFGAAFDAPVFAVSARDRDTVRYLGGPDVEILMPSLDPNELAFYERRVAEPPARPWLTGRLPLEELDTEALAESMEWIGSEDQASPALVDRIRASAAIEGSVYTPRIPRADVELWAEVRLANRTVWAGSVQSPYPGHHLVVDVSDIPLPLLTRATEGAASCGAEQLARAVARIAAPVLAEATHRVLASLRPSNPAHETAAGRIVLAALARGTISRLRRDDDGEVRVRLAAIDDRLTAAVFDTPILRTVAGRPLSVKDLEHLMTQTAGLVHGQVLSGEAGLSDLPDELNPDRIVALDNVQERILINLVGEASYAPVRPKSEPLARASGLVCGDLRAGLVPAANFPLFVDGDPSTATGETVVSLVEQLLGVWRDANQPARRRRTALRHLLWFVAHAEDRHSAAVAGEPLLRNADGHGLTIADVEPALKGDGIMMIDGWSVDPLSPGMSEESVDSPRLVLAMNPFVLQMLSRLGPIQPVLDVDLSAAEARTNAATPDVAFLESTTMSGGLQGTIGFPMMAVAEPAILLFDRRRGRASTVGSIGPEFGLVGRLEISDGRLEGADLERRCTNAAQGLLDALIKRLPALSGAEHRRALEVLLGYAKTRIGLHTEPDGTLVVSTYNVTTRRILDLPLFPSTAGVAVTPWRVLREFAAFGGDREAGPSRTRLSADAPDFLHRWLDDVLAPERIVASSSRPDRSSETYRSLNEWLTRNLADLRPDDEAPYDIRILSPPAYERTGWTHGIEPTGPMFLTADTIFLRSDFWLLGTLFEGDEAVEPRPTDASWVLLALYAKINELKLSVTNVHEMHFQSTVLDWLDFE